MDSILPRAIDRDTALAARYGADTMPRVGPWNETIASMLGHRSVRGYLPTPVPEGTLESMIAAAQSAATSSNIQAWSVVHVTDPAKKAALAEIAGNQKHIEQCPLYLVWIADLERNLRIGTAAGVEMVGAPWTETFMVAVIDAALAAQNAVVAAESLGLSTVYIGAMRNDPERVASLLELPPQAFAVFGLCVGHAEPKAASEVKPRLPQDVIVHHNRYSSEGEEAKRIAYDAMMAEFSRRHELQVTTWSQRVLNRLGNMRSLNGRERIKARLNALGFPLR